MDCISRLSLVKDKSSGVRIALLGLDEVEIADDATLKQTFEPMLADLRQLGVGDVLLECVGPCIPLSMHGKRLERSVGDDNDDKHKDGYTDRGTPVTSVSVTLKATYTVHSMLYHDYVGSVQGGAPDLIIMYNAGLWGYDDWVPTLEVLREVAERRAAFQQPMAVLVTSYTLAECRADMDCVEDALGEENLVWHWRAKVNPHGSSVDMRRTTHKDTYLENFATLCFGYDKADLVFPADCPLLSRENILRCFEGALEEDGHGAGASTLGLLQTRCCVLSLLGLDLSAKELVVALGPATCDANAVGAKAFMQLVLDLYRQRMPADWYEDAVMAAVGQHQGGSGDVTVTSTSFSQALSGLAPSLAAKQAAHIFALADEYQCGKIGKSQFRRMVTEDDA